MSENGHREQERFEGADPELGEPAVRGMGDGPMGPIKTRQPAGLWVLFITEMWERFSYYGMRALFVLYLYKTTAPMLADGTANNNPGFGWDKADATTLYGIYTFMVYLTSIFEGIAADRLLGTHRSMILDGLIIAAGHIMLAFMSVFQIEPGQVVTMQTSPGALLSFMLGCSLIIIGTGFFKPCVSVMVGQLYEKDDPRRDSGFTIFYMGINLGAFFSPLVAGSLGEKVGWHWGFGSAAVGMILGLIFYSLLRKRYLGTIGSPPEKPLVGKKRWAVYGSIAVLVGIPLLPLALYITDSLAPITDAWSWFATKLGPLGMAAFLSSVFLGSVLLFIFKQDKEARSRLAVVFILAFFGNIFFWTAFEQVGSSMTVFANDNTNRHVFGWEFPATWFQSINPLTILLFAPVFSWLWIFLDRRRKNPSTPMKFAFGLWLLGLAFLAMVGGSLQARDGQLAGPYWLLITYVAVTWGELCLSPVGLSMVTKLSPKPLQSLMMGLWFFSLALSNLTAGLVASFSEKFISQDGADPELTFITPGLPGFFLMLVIFPIAAGVVIAIITPLLKKMMKGIH